MVSKLDYYEGLPHCFHSKWFIVNYDDGSVDADASAVFPTLPVAHEMMTAPVEGVRFLLSKQRPL